MGLAFRSAGYRKVEHKVENPTSANWNRKLEIAACFCWDATRGWILGDVIAADRKEGAAAATRRAVETSALAADTWPRRPTSVATLRDFVGVKDITPR